MFENFNFKFNNLHLIIPNCSKVNWSSWEVDSNGWRVCRYKHCPGIVYTSLLFSFSLLLSSSSSEKTDQYPNEDSPQSTEMPVGPALEEEEEDGDQCKGGNRSQCILVILVWWNHYPDMVCDNAVPFLGSPAWPEWLNQIWIFNWNETCVVFIVTKMWTGRWQVVTNIKY